MGTTLATYLPVRPNSSDTYDRTIFEQSFQAVEFDLQHKLDRRSDLYLDPGKTLVLTNASGDTAFALGISAGNVLQLINYATGAVGDFVVNWNNVEGLSQQLVNLETAFEDADTAVTNAGVDRVD